MGALILYYAGCTLSRDMDVVQYHRYTAEYR